MAVEEQNEGVEVAKWYTRARKFPQLIGKTPDGTNIWGGPYTYTQVIVGGALLFLGSKTVDYWGKFDLLGNAVLLFGVTYATVLLIGRLPLGARNPLVVLVGALQAFTAPPQGKLAGTPLRLRRPHVVRSTLVVAQAAPLQHTPTSGATPVSEVASVPQQEDPGKSPRRLPRRHGRPNPASTPASRRAPALTGVQQLLASAGTPTTKD